MKDDLRTPLIHHAPYVFFGIVLLSLGTFLAYVFYYYPFLADDALISLRYSERFANGLGLTWNDGERVEGYTNLLWVLANGVLAWFHIDLILACRILGVGCGIWIFIAGAYYLKPAVKRHNSFYVWVAIVPLFYLASSPPLASWSIGGLENSMLAACLAQALLMLKKASENNYDRLSPLLWAGVALGGLVLTRADAPLLVASMGVAVWVMMNGGFAKRCKVTFALAIIPFACFVGQMLFRIFYYEDYLPNTYYVKFAMTERRRYEGIVYILEFLGTKAPMIYATAVVVLALAYSGFKQRASGVPIFGNDLRNGFIILFIALVHMYYVAIAGGDIFPAFRHLVIVDVLFAFLLGNLFLKFQQAALPIKFKHAVGLICALSIVATFPIGHNHPANMRAKIERWEWGCKEIAEHIVQEFGDLKPLMAVTAAGCLPYFTGYPSIDMYGLNDKTLSKWRPENFGNDYMGHELMNPHYVLSRKPDLITFYIAKDDQVEGDFKSRPEFKEYILVKMPLPTRRYVAHVWMHMSFMQKLQQQINNEKKNK